MIHDHQRLETDRPRNAMSVDVEDYFQVSAFEKALAGRDWESFECRIPRNVERILELFDAAGARATFFTLGWVAERFPAARAAHRGVGPRSREPRAISTRASRANRGTIFRADVKRTKQILEDHDRTAGTRLSRGSYSIGADNLWALDVLGETGHVYSSSIYPIRHDLYGMPERRDSHSGCARTGILEVPVTTGETAGKSRRRHRESARPRYSTVVTAPRECRSRASGNANRGASGMPYRSWRIG